MGRASTALAQPPQPTNPSLRRNTETCNQTVAYSSRKLLKHATKWLPIFERLSLPDLTA
jgi:hypothetical protein